MKKALPTKALDKTDLKILRLLQENGRISMTELAERVGLSTTPCTERVRRLERDGVIEGYYARLNPQAVGAGLLVFVEIKLSAKSGDIFDAFRREIQKIPQIMECHLVSGEYDYLIKARLPDMSMYRKLLGDILLQLPAANESHSYVVMEEVKETLLLPVPN
jgi:Lrp/AsnC family leucine-responsive transcriptional regulator